MKKIIALILSVTFLLEQPLSAKCFYLNCVDALENLNCKCGTDCFGEVWFRGFHKHCVGGTASYSYPICENKPEKVGWSAPCVREYNWAAIAGCAGTAGGSIPACIVCVKSYLKGKPNKDACLTCASALAQIPNACSFCELVTCEVGVKTPDIRGVLSLFKKGEGCGVAPGLCDPNS